MKKLKLTINGKVNTFDLPGNGEYKCEVEESYTPKVGDCVKVESRILKKPHYWFKIKKIEDAIIEFSLAISEDLNIVKIGFFIVNNDQIYTQITPEELKAKYAEAGYDWDYESDTIKPLKWMPKDGEGVWYFSSMYEPIKHIFYKKDKLLQSMVGKGLLFKTEEECQKFCNYCLNYFKK